MVDGVNCVVGPNIVTKQPRELSGVANCAMRSSGGVCSRCQRMPLGPLHTVARRHQQNCPTTSAKNRAGAVEQPHCGSRRRFTDLHPIRIAPSNHHVTRCLPRIDVPAYLCQTWLGCSCYFLSFNEFLNSFVILLQRIFSTIPS